MKKFPTKISPCSIIEATIELKFDSDLPKGAVFGILYNALKDSFGKVEQLPLAALPLEVIENDPNFKYKALYRLTDGTFDAQVGYDVVTFHSPKEYIGWEEFAKNIVVFFEKVKKSQVVTTPISLLLRYVNFFEFNIYEKINLQIELLNEKHTSNNLVFRTEFLENNFWRVLQVANNVTMSGDFGQKQGSLVEIICSYNESNILENFENIINEAHQIEKELFFGLLKPEFLTTLNPQYDE